MEKTLRDYLDVFFLFYYIRQGIGSGLVSRTRLFVMCHHFPLIYEMS